MKKNLQKQKNFYIFALSWFWYLY